MFNSITIRTRLIATMSVIGILMLVLGGLSIFGMNTVNFALKDVYSNQMASTISLGNAKNFLNRSRFVIDRGVFHPEAPDLEKTLGRAEGFIQDSDKAWKEYLALPLGDDEKVLAKDLEGKRAVYVGELRALISALRAQDQDKIENLSMKTLSAQFGIFDAASVKLEDYQLTSAKDHYEQSQSFFSTFTKSYTVALVLGAALIIFSAVRLLRAILRPLQHALGHFDQIATGNLANQIDISRNDEMGKLMQGLQKMQDQMSSTVSSIRTGSSAIATASAEIASGNLDLSRRTENQAAALEETASSLEELTSTVRQNADNARQANQLALSAQDVAGKGGQLVSQVVDTMGNINTSSRKIADIIGVIDGIAFQTNILALNAAVEAARAGEQGRGFAVVATEVRNLAQRSAAAAKEIKELITESVEQVDAGNQLVDKAGATMNEIVSSVERVTSIMTEIMIAGEEQSEGINQINQAIVSMDEVTQQNAALVEEAAAAANSMQEQAAQLEEMVSTFKVESVAASRHGGNRPALRRPALALGH
ncbi:HAMP domain-containing protein [Pseudoduganella sp. FT26W]|uniref:HAMP domain-containing protein n=1 Tax=Duganella aquatilis TaxID=2666082 RepID=A0A844D4H6_9BURK|nr:methyl-accepting chemotaxis protein [Duganella aquatilis]MRW84705.1 HAMP domain-containing protein [Duganella aquatilis]